MPRRHQTLKRHLVKQTPAQTLAELQGQLAAFARYYNHTRPHRALAGGAPLQASSARLKARPATADPATHFRVRHDKVDAQGKVSLRYDSRLYKIGLGRAHKGTALSAS
jgi:Integrase core domain